MTVVTEHHIVKVRTHDDPYFLGLLRHERDFLAAGLTLPMELQEAAFEDFGEERGVLATRRTSGSPPPDWISTYDRKEKLARE